MAALPRNVPRLANSFMMKAFPAIRALDFAFELGFTKIVLEGDALLVLKKIKRTSVEISPIGTVIEDSKVNVDWFVVCNVSHVKKSGNVVPHKPMF
ncbi:hypothetical protein REPUB_Repub04eG0159100 [Reevesia pubescens]